MRRYLLFDSHCSKCTDIAHAIEKEAGGKLEAVGLHDEKARELLDSVYPNGWEHAPYLVTVSKDRAQAWKGLGLAAHLAWLLGPRKALNVWGTANTSRPIQAETPSTVNVSSRRWFLRGGFVAVTAGIVGAFLLPTSTAFACIPCRNCGRECDAYLDCSGVSCAYPDVRHTYLIKDCYDAATGEYCITTIKVVCRCCCQSA